MMKNNITFLQKILILLLFVNCSNKKEYSQIYFFDVENFHTSSALTCLELNTYTGLKKITIKDDDINKLIFELFESIDFNSNQELDSRYKIEFMNRSICLNNSGDSHLIKEKNKQKSLFIKIKNYTKENEDKAIEVTKPTYKRKAPDFILNKPERP